MYYEFCSRTDRGLRRENNEDAVIADPKTGLAILADGMGGYNAGEVASDMAVKLTHSHMGHWLVSQGQKKLSSQIIARELRHCVGQVNTAIWNAALEDKQYAGMGTTLVVGMFQPQSLVLGHIGDSRCYRLRGEVLQQITRDHSFLQEQIDAGLLTRAQARTSANRNLVTRAVGVEEAVELEVQEHTVEPNDLHLLCSDGLSDMLDETQMQAILSTSLSLDQKAKRLIEAANAAGGRDNITVLLVRSTQGAPKTGWSTRWSL